MNLYSLFENFALRVGVFSEATFPSFMKSFYKNLENKGLPKKKDVLDKYLLYVFQLQVIILVDHMMMILTTDMT
jgi:hypothetical protein